MAINIWNKCDGIKHIKAINETAWRIVESQEITSTRKLVDSLEEQIILEDMLESSKPIISNEHLSFHPLLYTPFRYPPLKHGSRFSKKTEPALWYGSLNIDTAMAEKAYYQFNFIRACEADFDIVQIPLTVFSTRINTNKGIKLTETPFSDYTNIISSPASYDVSQQLGNAMRETNVLAFTYKSARHTNNGVNIGLFSINAFLRKQPEASSFQTWQCMVSGNSVEFIRSSSINTETKCFSSDTFLVNGILPFPAN